MAKSHFKLHQPVKIDGVDFQAGFYPIDEIDSGRHSSIINAGWGDYCDAPKAKAKVKTDKVETDDDADLDDDPDADDDIDEIKKDEAPKPAKPKPARSRAKK